MTVQKTTDKAATKVEAIQELLRDRWPERIVGLPQREQLMFHVGGAFGRASVSKDLSQILTVLEDAKADFDDLGLGDWYAALLADAKALAGSDQVAAMQEGFGETRQ